jgi:nucleotide-binding universal stress UspA family protein
VPLIAHEQILHPLPPGVQNHPEDQWRREDIVMKINKILVPVDGSEHSTKAAQYAADLANLCRAEIMLLHCHRAFPKILGEPYFQNAVTKTLNESNELLEPYRKRLAAMKITFIDRVLEGPAGHTIPEVARIESCDLIVMGSRGLSDLEGLLLGSVAHRVLHAASVPVLIVR